MKINILHTSDWHLGKKLHRLDRIEEQQLFLQAVIEIIKEKKIDHLFIAGDIFDSPQPSHQALKLWTQFLSQFLIETKATLWAIAGNHDSSTLLEIPQVLVDKNRIHLFGHLAETPDDHWFVLKKENLQIDLCLLPYFRPHEVYSWKNYYKIDSQPDNILPKIIESFLKRTNQKQNSKKILLSHHLFGSFQSAGSEQSVFLSGLESIPLSWCEGFDYLALGHIHKPQKIKSTNPTAYYTGSPIPMRFSEKEEKSILLLEIDDQGIQITPHPLPVFRELISLTVEEEHWKTHLSDLPLKPAPLSPAFEITIKRKEIKQGLHDQIREFMEKRNWQLLSLIIEETHQHEQKELALSQLKNLSLTDLFEAFYMHRFPQANQLPIELLEDFKTLLSEVNKDAN